MASQPSLVSEPQACETLRLQSKIALEERQLRLCSGFYTHVYMCGAYILSLSRTQSQRQLDKTPKAAWWIHFIAKRKVNRLHSGDCGARSLSLGAGAQMLFISSGLFYC